MVYLVTVGLLCLLSLVLNAIVLNLNDRDVYFQKDMPKWVKIKIYISLRTYIYFCPIINMDNLLIDRSDRSISSKVIFVIFAKSLLFATF